MLQFANLSGRTLESEDYEIIKHANITKQKRKRKIQYSRGYLQPNNQKRLYLQVFVR